MIDSPNTWMAIAVSDPDGQRFEQHTHNLPYFLTSKVISQGTTLTV